MGRSPYLRTWHKLPTVTASDGAPSPPRQPVPVSDSLPRDIPSESAFLRNPYLSRGRQLGGKKKRSASIEPVPVADKDVTEAADLSAKEKKNVGPSRLYLRRWYPA